MILLDTHIWIWWVANLPRLSHSQRNHIRDHQDSGLGISIISCWEIAKKCELGKLELDRPIVDWLDVALRFPGIQLVSLTPEIVVASTQLPGEFHRDPADQLIVATARTLNCPLLTVDQRLVDYPHVTTLT